MALEPNPHFGDSQTATSRLPLGGLTHRVVSIRAVRPSGQLQRPHSQDDLIRARPRRLGSEPLFSTPPQGCAAHSLDFAAGMRGGKKIDILYTASTASSKDVVACDGYDIGDCPGSH